MDRRTDDRADGIPEVRLDEAPSGWDPYVVWRRRVKEARGGAVQDDAPGDETGWDAGDVWRDRVQRARRPR